MIIRIFIVLLLLISTEGGFSQVADSAMRRVPLQGAVNFRDLGGYATVEGKHVRWKVVYRSADISRLTPADLDTLKERRIRFDVDLRGVAESAQAPDRVNAGTDYILCPAGSDSTNGQLQKFAGLQSGGDSLMRSFYTNTHYLAARYKPFFSKLLVLPEEDALVFHCTAGKDRTGIGAALFLYALGVPYEKIREDYVATNYYRAGDNARMIHVMMDRTGVAEPVAKSMMSANGEYLDAAFDAIRSEYGSIDRFLEIQLGMDHEKLVALRARYLE
jgi:protein-tyrosine phosphatase